MRVAIIGHIPHDRYVLADGSRYTGFGGILYGVAGLVAALGPQAEVVAISRVGQEIYPQVMEILGRYPSVIPRIEPLTQGGWTVYATYLSGEVREERLVGHVPPWTAAELLPLVEGCGAVLLNMVTGFEVELPHYLAFASACPLLHLDFHSLALARGPDGLRSPAPRPDARLWCARATVLQMNLAEAHCVLPGTSPLEAAAVLSTWGPRWVALTAGSGGAYVATSGQALHVPAVDPDPHAPDPTGCGDVFGATLLAGFLRGLPLEVAARAATTAARRNAQHRGIPSPQDLLS